MESLALLAIGILAVPFVLPILSWLAGRRVRQRVDALEERLDEQNRAIRDLTVQLKRLSQQPPAAGPAAATAPPPAAPAPAASAPPPRERRAACCPAARRRATSSCRPAGSSRAAGSGCPARRASSTSRRCGDARGRTAAAAAAARVATAAASVTAAGVRLVLRLGAADRRQAVLGDRRHRAGVRRRLLPALLDRAWLAAAAGPRGDRRPRPRIALLVACELKAARRYPVTANAMDAAAIAILFATFFSAHSLWNLIPGHRRLRAAGAGDRQPRCCCRSGATRSSLRSSASSAALRRRRSLSTGENQPIPLFAYLLLLNVGLAWVAYRRGWSILSAASLS